MEEAQETTDTDERVPFDVTDEVVIEDLTDVKEQKFILPVSHNVLVKIKTAELRANRKPENGAAEFKLLNLQIRLVDGVEVLDKETGESEWKYKNKPLFTGLMDLIVWHDAEVKVSPWWKERKYAVEFKKFLLALEYDIKSPPAINDKFFEEIVGREVRVDVLHEEEQALDTATGDWKGIGTFKERLKNWKKADV